MGIPSVKQKLTISGGGPLTVKGLQDALGVLRQGGAPAEGGKLTVNQGPAGWAMFVEWSPTIEPRDGDDLDAHQAARKVQDQVRRRLGDNPQA